MSENKEKIIETIKTYVPSTKAAIRAGISAIPYVGGSIDHLLYDKSDEIRMKNLEKLINELSECVTNLQEKTISKEWFESTDAIDMFKNLYNKVEFESDAGKIRALSRLYCRFGTEEHKDDPNKLAVLESVSKMTNNQRIIFMVVNQVPVEEKTSTGEAINYTAKSKWQSIILEHIKQKEVLSKLEIPPTKIELVEKDGKVTPNFKRGTILVDVELDILASLNLLRIDHIPNMNDVGYEVTALGRLVYSYLKETN